MRILGIDPGSSRIGFGAIEKTGSKLTLIETGVLEIREREVGMKLGEVARRFAELLDRVGPERIGIERIFFSKNAKTAIEVAEARGLILHLSIVRLGTEGVFEFTPQQVKVATTNYGGADKKAVAKMVSLLLKLPPIRALDDATDALAVAIAAAHSTRT